MPCTSSVNHILNENMLIAGVRVRGCGHKREQERELVVERLDHIRVWASDKSSFDVASTTMPVSNYPLSLYKIYNNTP